MNWNSISKAIENGKQDILDEEESKKEQLRKEELAIEHEIKKAWEDFPEKVRKAVGDKQAWVYIASYIGSVWRPNGKAQRIISSIEKTLKDQGIQSWISGHDTCISIAALISDVISKTEVNKCSS